MPFITTAARATPRLYRPENRQAASAETWRCGNPYCAVWVRPSRAPDADTCDVCGYRRAPATPTIDPVAEREK